MVRILFSIALLSLCMPVHARLGEGGGKCAERYGSPIRTESIPGGYLCEHQKNGFEITIVLINNTCTVMMFSKPGERWSADEIAVLLDLNGLKDRHQTPTSQPGLTLWMTRDKSLIGSYDRSGKTLVVGYTAYLARMDENSKNTAAQNARNATAGF